VEKSESRILKVGLNHRRPFLELPFFFTFGGDKTGMKTTDYAGSADSLGSLLALHPQSLNLVSIECVSYVSDFFGVNDDGGRRRYSNWTSRGEMTEVNLQRLLLDFRRVFFLSLFS
jgi:hypothetical protein